VTVSIVPASLFNKELAHWNQWLGDPKRILWVMEVSVSSCSPSGPLRASHGYQNGHQDKHHEVPGLFPRARPFMLKSHPHWLDTWPELPKVQEWTVHLFIDI
jgi:hypothetical protein